jgi:hypothetical protein
MKNIFIHLLLFSFLIASKVSYGQSTSDKGVILENNKIAIEIDARTGAITSFRVKGTPCDLIGEKRLVDNFRLCVPLEGYLCNYIDGMKQTPSSVSKDGETVYIQYSGMKGEKGSYDISLRCSITLEEDRVIFKSKLENNCGHKISEFWFPRLGGWTGLFSGRDAKLAMPGYTSCGHNFSLFRNYPGRKNLGSEAAEFAGDYPEMVMPWWDIYDSETNTGLYMGYHDKTFRYSTWHTYLFPDVSRSVQDTWLDSREIGGAPVGLVFSHVRYPFIGRGETFETGEFVIRVHAGDWHDGAKFYREWFMKHFPFDKSKSWLRKKSAWFSAILYQPEDRVITDYKGFGQWCRDAQEYGVECCELLGWDKGGIERDYPAYVPEEKLGGKEGFKNLLKEIKNDGGKCLVFVNYNVLDGASDWFRNDLKKYQHQDEFGQTPNWMGWGESTLIARRSLSVRRHVLSSVVPGMTDILEDYFVKIAEDGADGLQIDKLCVGSALDFNPLNTEKPDVALCEGLVQAIGRLLEKCRKVNPEFCIASEAVQDRLIPYVDVYYRNSDADNISPLRVVFPEWTSCQHISAPEDYNGIHGAVLTGSVIDVEPEMYSGTLKSPLWLKTANHIREVERIRKELQDIIFLGNYFDTAGAGVTVKSQAGSLSYRVHGRIADDKRAITIMNSSGSPKSYSWEFTHKEVKHARLYSPFEPVRTVTSGTVLEISSEGLHILVEE